MKLVFAKENITVKIKSLAGGVNFKRRLEEIGLLPGKEITVLKSGPGPVLIKLENRKIGLGLGEAMKIEVEEIK